MAQLSDLKFTELLTKTAKACAQLTSLQQLVNRECVARYGLGYQQAKADNLVVTLDEIGSNGLTEKEFNEQMWAAGYQRLDLIVAQLKQKTNLTLQEQDQLNQVESQLTDAVA